MPWQNSKQLKMQKELKIEENIRVEIVCDFTKKKNCNVCDLKIDLMNNSTIKYEKLIHI